MSDEESGLADADDGDVIREYLQSLVPQLVLNEIVRKCGGKWCLYTKHKKNGKRRRLGTHPTKAAAYRQERAIKARGG